MSRSALTFVTGKPLPELKALGELRYKRPRICGGSPRQQHEGIHRTPAAISFVRSRMLFARPALNSRGGVTFGLRHIREYYGRF